MNPFLQEAKNRDKIDSLSQFKHRFINDKTIIYLDGNSLGKLPKETIKTSKEILQNQWGTKLIQSWNEHWMELPNIIAKKIAKIVGAQPDEIFVGDTTSINLYKLLFAALNHQQDKFEIVTDDLNFPTDLYIIQGLLAQQFQKHSLKIVKSNKEINVSNLALEKAISGKTAVVTLSLVSYKSSFLYNMNAVNNLVHKNGGLTLWDLSHAAGAVEVNLNETNADLAVGCTYKYLNGGPGAPAFLYVRKDLQEKLTNPIWSWFAHEKPFDFNPNFSASKGIQKFAVSTPSILSLGAISPALDIILEAGMKRIQLKSKDQSEYLISLIKEFLIPLNFEIVSPLNTNERGSHVSIKHPESYRINRAMINPKNKLKKSIIPDFRPPNLIRLGITPLYLSFEDLYEAVLRIKEIVITKEYENFSNEKLLVT